MTITISINDNLVMTIDDNMIKMMQYDNPSAEITNIITKSVLAGANDVLNRSKTALQNIWLPILFNRYESIPTAQNAIGNLIYSQEDYKDYDQRNNIGG